jgi:hypothetical protein
VLAVNFQSIAHAGRREPKLTPRNAALYAQRLRAAPTATTGKVTLRFDPFGWPLCDECRAHWDDEHDRLNDSFRAVFLADPDPKQFLPVRRAYFTAFHDGGHVKNDDWDAVDEADPTPYWEIGR